MVHKSAKMIKMVAQRVGRVRHLHGTRAVHLFAQDKHLFILLSEIQVLHTDSICCAHRAVVQSYHASPLF